MGLAEPELAFGKPGKGGACGRHRLFDPGLRRIGNLSAHPVHMGKELGVLAAAAAKRQTEAPPGQRRSGQPQKHIAGIAGDDPLADPDRECRVKVTTLHPARRLACIDRLDGPEHRIGSGCLRRPDQLSDPVRARCLVIVDKGQEISRGIVEAGIAGNRDIGRRAMHVDDAVRHGSAQTVDAAFGARGVVIISNDDADIHIAGNVQLCQRA